MGFRASYLDIQPHELVRHLLREAGQLDRESVNPADMLEYLNLDYVSFDFAREIPRNTYSEGERPRALFSFHERLVAVDEKLIPKRTRFSVLHEIAHYVLPRHQHVLYLCDDQGLSSQARLECEIEANQFAADVLFLGDKFTLEANAQPISALTIRTLALKYGASFEATARRLVQRSVRPCMFMAFEAVSGAEKIDTDRQPTWRVRYCIASPRFRADYFAELRGTLPEEIASVVACPGVDIAKTVECEVLVEDRSDQPIPLKGEFFYNQYNVFCLLLPA